MRLDVFSFPGLGSDTRPDERIVAVIHKHWWALLREMVLVVILFLVPFIAIPILGSFVQSGNAAELGATVGFLGSLWALICWQYLFVRWTDYYFDVWIVTNWRIIDVELKGLFNIDIATILDLDHIEDIRTESVGFISNILNFGKVFVQTAGASREFEFEDAPNPRKIERIIRDTQTELATLKRAEERALHT